MASEIEVPQLIRAAGKPAVRSYREFLEDERLSANTRRVYGGACQTVFPMGRKPGPHAAIDHRRRVGLP